MLSHIFGDDRTDGTVIFASGGPFSPIQHDGKKLEPGQGNNMYIFPGIGFGSILCKARHVTDGMVEHSAIALATALEPDELEADLLYPRLTRIRDVSAKIVLAVIRKAQADVSHFYLPLLVMLSY
jgi:malate dehydrogenase (oxaloacetate-decarboxylating)(NADP+)